jgi:hypothetical protein
MDPDKEGISHKNIRFLLYGVVRRDYIYYRAVRSYIRVVD